MRSMRWILAFLIVAVFAAQIVSGSQVLATVQSGTQVLAEGVTQGSQVLATITNGQEIMVPR